MNHVTCSLSASLLALSLVAASSVAFAAEPFVTSLTPSSLSSAASGSTLLPSPSSPRALPGLPSENGPVPMQIDGGQFNQRTVVLTFPDGAPLATMYVFNTAIGSFRTGIEYWYVNRSAISGNLGAHGFTVSVTDSSPGSAPSDPGYSPEQRFQQAQNPSGGWGSGWTTDPFNTGDLYAGPNNTYVRFMVSTGSPPAITWVIWYQVLSSGSPANLNPSGSWSTASGSVPVPSGSTGYYIAQATD